MNVTHGKRKEPESDDVEVTRFTAIPDELLRMIFSELDFQTRRRCERVCWRWTCVIREAKNLRIPNGLEGYVSVDLAQEGEDQMRELQLPFMDRIKDRIRNMDENITVRREVSFLEVKDSRVPSLLKSHLYWSSLAVFARMPLFKECRPRVIILDGITLRINELEKYRIRAAFERGRRVILRGVRVLVYPRKKGSQTFDEEVRNPLIRTIGYMMANPFACGGVFGQAIRHLEAEEVRHPLSEFERHQITQIGKTQIGKSVYPDHTQAYVMLDEKHEPWATWYDIDSTTTPLWVRALLHSGTHKGQYT